MHPDSDVKFVSGMLNKTPISQLSVDKLFETIDGAEAARSRMLQLPLRNRLL